MTNPNLTRMQTAAGGLGGPNARGSAVDAASGLPSLVSAKGAPLPPSANLLQVQEEAERHAKLDRAWRHYTGELHGHFRPEPGQPDINVLTNRASAIVDTGVDFLYGKLVTLEVLLNGKPQKDAQACLDGCWGKDARRMTTMSKLGQNGGIFGQVFAKIIEPDPPGRPYSRVVPLDPAQVSVVTDPDDCDTVLAYIIDYQRPDTRFKQLQVGKRQVILRRDPDDATEHEDNNDLYSYDLDAWWEISNWLRGPNNTWYELGEPEKWPHQWAPVIDWQNLPLANMHWGQSDIPPNVLHLNSVLNLTLSNINALAKYHGAPIVSVSGANPDTQLNIGPGKVIKFPAPDTKMSALEAYGDIPGLLEFAERMHSAMDEQTRVPPFATGYYRDVPNFASGVAYQLAYAPLISKNGHKQRLYETGHEEVSLRMLSLCGYGDGTGMDGWEVVTHWPSPLPNDDASTAQLALAAEQTGMSQHFIISDIFEQDYDTEMGHRKDEAAEQIKAFARGQGMPPGMPVGEPVQAGPASAGVTTPPGPSGPQPAGNPAALNHPAAQAARGAMSAMAKG